MIATVPARWLVYKTDKSQGECPDWMPPEIGIDFGLPMAKVRGKRVEMYVGRLTREMARKLFAEIE